MSVTYGKLWKILTRKRLRKTDLMKGAGLDGNIMAKLGRDEYVSLRSLEKICDFLNCDVGNIVQIDRREPEIDKKRDLSVEEVENFLFGGES